MMPPARKNLHPFGGSNMFPWISAVSAHLSRLKSISDVEFLLAAEPRRGIMLRPLGLNVSKVQGMFLTPRDDRGITSIGAGVSGMLIRTVAQFRSNETQMPGARRRKFDRAECQWQRCPNCPRQPDHPVARHFAVLGARPALSTVINW